MPRRRPPQERHAFGLTILFPSHPEVWRLQQAAVQPTLHGHKVCFIFEATVKPEQLARLQETGDRMLGYGVKPLSTGALLHAIGALFDKLSNL